MIINKCIDTNTVVAVNLIKLIWDIFIWAGTGYFVYHGYSEWWLILPMAFTKLPSLNPNE